MVAVPLQIGVFGKVPWAGDFVQFGIGAGHEILLSWVEQGIALGADRGESWRRRFEGAAQKAFVIPLSLGHVACGVISPSRDEVGRRFPLTILGTSEAPIAPHESHILPLALGNFLQSAGEVASSLIATPEDLASAARRLAPVATLSGADHLESFGAWVHSASLRTVGQAIFGGGWREALGHALYVCIESVRPFSGIEPPPTPLAVRLPLGAGFAGAVALWLCIVRRCSRWERHVPAAFWSFEPDRSWVTIFFGQLPPLGFTDLWVPEPESETLSDLTLAPTALAPHLASVHPEAARVVLSDDATVADLLRVLGN